MVVASQVILAIVSAVAVVGIHTVGLRSVFWEGRREAEGRLEVGCTSCYYSGYLMLSHIKYGQGLVEEGKCYIEHMHCIQVLDKTKRWEACQKGLFAEEKRFIFVKS